ncbi:hypothetical protein [Natribacillus halophilus]|uniref:Uncharacterized protein n=1 Tax=Natribacillus halophilus TaxID=549003 RepID=A0A1G8P1L6_9BACI|nr:hypothetical protein [Natribacillus halophilus]SDI86403.1 hypothetical protein SAMN04488123_107150 [Natribacillus halophilus]
MSLAPICITGFVYGIYTKYIPFYIYSILKSYPDYYVKIFTDTPLSAREQSCLRMIKQRLSKRFEVKENDFADFKVRSIAEGKARRFLIPRHEFRHFENVYVGDVDFLLVRESPSLLASHLQHCENIGLPYSNQIRPNSKRLTGLHFFKVQPYYEQVEHRIKHYLHHHGDLAAAFQTIKRDEEFLYRLMEETIGFGRMDVHHYRPHHGFHLGILRSGSARFKDYVKNGPQNAFHQLPDYATLKKQLLQYFADPLFTDMKNIVDVKEIRRLQQWLRPY